MTNWPRLPAVSTRLRYVGSVVRDEPPVTAVLAATLGGCRRRRADELDPVLRQQPLALPHASLEIQQAEPGEVAGVRVHLAAQNEIAEPIGADEGVAHADAIEQGLSRGLRGTPGRCRWPVSSR